MKTTIKSTFFLFLLFTAFIGKAQFPTEVLKYTQFLNYLDRYYVDSIDTKKLVEEAIIGHLKKLDPHSVYISAEDVQRMNEPLQGNFEGVGISFNILNDTLFVVEAISGGPSEKVGIKAGDRIIKVDDENIGGVGLTNDDVFRLLRGEKGTRVDVAVKRRGVGKLLYFTITRDKIPIFSLDASYMAADSVGYIKLNRFSQTTIEEFVKAAKVLKFRGAKDLILDLSGNTGGYLDMAVSLADQFLGDLEVIVYTEGLNSPRHNYYAMSKGLFEEGRIVILIDQGSASASEILSGAIQDWDRGLIIGRRSFGKGLVQRQLQLPDGSMVRLTTAKYYTPTGRLIQKPYDNGLDEYNSEIYNRYENGEFSSMDSIDLPDSLQYRTLKSNRVVFGGGGITPDLFVPIDTMYYTDYYFELSRRGILNQFVLQYVDKNRADLLHDYGTFGKYRSGYVVSDKIISDLTKYAEKEGLELNDEQLEISKSRIKHLIKAYIARDVWSTSEFYEIINEENENYLKALEVFENWEMYSSQIIN